MSDHTEIRGIKPPTGPTLPLENRSYLLVFTPDTVFLVPLPLTGEFYLGEAPDHSLQFSDLAVSEMGARIITRGGEITIENLEGVQGLYLNGEAFKGLRTLSSGDVVSLGVTNLVLNRGTDISVGPCLVDTAQLNRRLPLELERALRYGRPVSVLCVKANAPDDEQQLEDTARLCELITSKLRLIDIVAWDGVTEFIVVLPETTSASAVVPARRVLDAVLPLAPHARAGLARCPGDGTDADSLLTGARSAASAATPGTINHLQNLGKTLKVGELVVVAIDPKVRLLYDMIRDVARSDIPVLVLGETGAGKEIVAQALHHWSGRSAGPMVSINCASLPEDLLQSELFGHEKGAFTGATAAKPGLLESAGGGTVFLDEVSECTVRIQAELLRVLETKRIRRLGSVKERTVDVRVVAATNRDLQLEVERGNFRKDLLYRLNASTILIPPLRHRLLDLPVLARLMMDEACSANDREPMAITESAMQSLLAYDWPGNVRELRNVMEQMAAVVHELELRTEHLPHPVGSRTAPWQPSGQTLENYPPQDEPVMVRPAETFRPLADEIKDLERARISQALAATNGVRVHAAKLIGMPLRTFVTKLKVHGLSMGRETKAYPTTE